MGICVPSMALTHWEKLHLQLNPTTTSWRRSPVGTPIYWGSNNSKTATHSAKSSKGDRNTQLCWQWLSHMVELICRHGASLEHKQTNIAQLNLKMSVKLSFLQQYTILSKKSLLYWIFHSLCWQMCCLAMHKRKTIKIGNEMSGTAIVSTYM